jgi:mRNA-degrading endonuclease toxin of MazEF toxin-antitoxin module
MKQSRLPKESVVNVSQIATLDRRILTERVVALSNETMTRVDAGVRLALAV